MPRPDREGRRVCQAPSRQGWPQATPEARRLTDAQAGAVLIRRAGPQPAGEALDRSRSRIERNGGPVWLIRPSGQILGSSRAVMGDPHRPPRRGSGSLRTSAAVDFAIARRTPGAGDSIRRKALPVAALVATPAGRFQQPGVACSSTCFVWGYAGCGSGTDPPGRPLGVVYVAPLTTALRATEPRPCRGPH